jgi:hypothetical protein
MPKYLQLLGLSVLMLLAACGGGDGGMQSTPTPTPSPTPTPTSLPLTSSATFDAIPATRIYVGATPGNIVMDRQGVEGRGSRVTVSYDAVAGTYTLRDEAASVSFQASDRTASSNFIDTYVKQAGGVTDELKVYGNLRNGTSGAPVALSYVTYGTWTHKIVPGDQTRNTVIVVGFPTPVADMPRTGSASYQTTVSGTMLRYAYAPSTLTDITGTATFNADFGANSVSTLLTLPTAGIFSGSAPIADNQFSGAFTSSTPMFQSGAFAGGFFGPAAQEMGYAFHITKYDPDPYAGAAFSPMYTYITGAVVGRKP